MIINNDSLLVNNNNCKSIIYHQDILSFDLDRYKFKNQVNVIITSPPYYNLRSYLDKEDSFKALEIGNQSTLESYLALMKSVFVKLHEMLTDDGVFWLNVGLISDQKSNIIDLPSILRDLCLEVGFCFKSFIIFKKNNAQPNGLKHRGTIDFEMVYLLAKAKDTSYFYDQEGYKEFSNPESMLRVLRGVGDDNKYSDGAPGQVPHSMNSFREKDDNRGVPLYRYARSVWDFNIKNFNPKKYGLDIQHFAVMPLELADRMLNLTTSRLGRCVVCKKQVKPYYEKKTLSKEALNKKEIEFLSQDKRLNKIKNFIINEKTSADINCCGQSATENVVVLDPFSGSGTTVLAAHLNNADSIGIELNKDFILLSEERIKKTLGI